MKKMKMGKFLAKAFLGTAFVLFMANPVYAEEMTVVTPISLTEYSELDVKAVDKETGLASGSFKAENGKVLMDKEQVFKVVLPEDGYYRLSLTGIFHGDEGIIRDYDNNQVCIALFADENCTKSVVDEQIIGLGAPSMDVFEELRAGNYYLRAMPVINDDEKSIDSVYSVSVGYLPKDTEFIKVNKTVDIESKKVVLEVSGLDAKSLKIKEGIHTGSSDLFGILWEGCAEIKDGGTYEIAKKGTDGSYTIRMVDKYDHTYGLVVKVPEFDAPIAPIVTDYKSGSATVSGKATANSTVTLRIGDKMYTAAANEDGSFSVTTDTLKVGDVIKAEAASTFGIKSEEVSTVTVLNRKLTKPVVKKIKKNAKKVTGKATKKATVYVKAGKKTYKAKVKANGTFTVKTSKLKKGTKVTVYVKDAYGNTSAKVKATVKAK